MHFYIPVTVVLATILIGCGETKMNETDNIEVQDSVTSVAVSSLYEDTAVAEEPFVYRLFEDYAQILTKAELYETFGAENLKDDTVYYAEGTVIMQQTTLENPNDGNIIHFVWSNKDNESLAILEANYTIYDSEYHLLHTQKIESECGLYTGMSLNEYRAWNGTEFSFSGFGWDYGGGIFHKEDTKGALCLTTARLSYEETSNWEDLEYVIGDQILYSDDEKVMKLPILIDNFTRMVEDVEF